MMMDIKIYPFSDLRSLRKASGLSQSELASLVHVSQNVISSYENFEYAPAGLVLAGLQSIFNCIFIFNNEQYEAWKLHNNNYTVGGTKDG